MIHGISSNSPHVIIHNGTTYSRQYVDNCKVKFQDSSITDEVVMRYNGDLRIYGTSIEVFIMGAWLPVVQAHAEIQTSGDLHNVIDWAHGKMGEESLFKDMLRLAKENKALDNAIENVRTALHDLELIHALVKGDKK